MQRDQESHEDNSSSASTDVELKNDDPDSTNPGYCAGHISENYDFNSCFDDFLSNSLTQEPDLSKQSETSNIKKRTGSSALELKNRIVNFCLSLERRDSDHLSW